MQAREAGVSTTIIGSFRFKDLIERTRRQFQDGGITVLAPPELEVTENAAGFKLLQGDTYETRRTAQQTFLEGMCRSNFHYIVTSGGHIGDSGGLEVLYNFLALGRPMFSNEPVTANPFNNHVLTVYNTIVENCRSLQPPLKPPLLDEDSLAAPELWNKMSKFIIPLEPEELIGLIHKYGPLPRLMTPLMVKFEGSVPSRLNPRRYAGLVIEMERELHYAT